MECFVYPCKSLISILAGIYLGMNLEKMDAEIFKFSIQDGLADVGCQINHRVQVVDRQ